MAFDLQDVLTPTSIGRIDHFLDDLTGVVGDESLQYNLEVLDQFGDVMSVRSGNEAAHLTQGQIDGLRAFMADRRAALPTDLGWAEGHVPGRCTWRFRDLDGTNPNRSLRLQVIELDDTGQFVARHRIDDQPNMEPTQVTNAIAFLDAQRAKAIAQILV